MNYMSAKEAKIMLINDEHLMETSEVSKRMGINAKMVRELIKYGLLPAIRFRRTNKVVYSQFVDFLQKYTGKDIYDVLEAAKAAK